MHLTPEACHERLLASAPLELAFAKHREVPFDEWRSALDGRVRELVELGPEPVALDVRVESETQHDGHREIRFVFTAEAGADVPCHLLLPDRPPAPPPVVICLQGHTPGMHLSLGRSVSDEDRVMLEGGDLDIAVHAVGQGYAALVLEQRCFGERTQRRTPPKPSIAEGCQHASLTALLLGRTMVGERCYDVSRAIDALAAFPQVDAGRLACVGNSGGGTTTLYAACLDPRISVAMPSCYVCTYRDSLASIEHCSCNYVPGILQYVEMGDLAGLIAPRPLIIVAGRSDDIFPIEGTERAFAVIQAIYAAAGAADRCRLVIGDGGHRFYPDEAWPVFRELSGWERIGA